MSRHRNIRSMDYSEEYDGYDDVYGHSVDDDSCISPSDAQQWIYDRNRGQQSMSAFIANHRNIEEETEEEAVDEEHRKQRRDSEVFKMPNLSDIDQARLISCIEKIRDVVGESISERRIVDAVLSHDFDCVTALDAILNDSQTIKTVSGSQTISTPSNRTRDPIEKDIGPKLMDKFTQKTVVPDAIVTVTPTSHDRSNVRRGFDISSPNIQSPIASGRNTPEPIANQSIPAIDDGKLSTMKIPKEQTNRNAHELYAKERADEKQHIHLVVIGHVDAGKSTLMGHVLYDLGVVPQRVMHKHEQESKKMGKQSFMYAWVLDETGEERERGITMDVGSTRFETATKTVTLLDAPGHKDFIPNMISGATQADVALLVVDATRGEFETGFEQGGQTREHALLVRSLGVSQLGVVVNKLDTVNWSHDRFDEIVSKLKIFLRQAGYKEHDVTYIPCSGLTGENLVKSPTDPNLLSWYKGPTLLTVIDGFKMPERSIDKPFRMSISDIFKGTGSGFCVSGRIETGCLCVNDKILVCPIRESATAKTISIDEMTKTTAFAGDQVTVTLSGVDVSNISIGFFLCDIGSPIPITNRLQARIIVFNIKVPITIGYPVLMHHQSLVEPASIVRLRAQLHKGTGEVVKKNPRFLDNNSCALIELETTRPICIERYADVKELGRVMLRVGGVTIAAGLVTKILSK